MSSKYNIVYSGLQDNITAETFVSRFCKTFGISEAKAEQIAASRSDVTIKKNVPGDKAAKYIKALEACGAIAYLQEQEKPQEQQAEQIQPGSGLSLEPIEDEQEQQEETQQPAVCPKCGSTNIKDDECLDCGIYISKYKANLEHVSEPESTTADSQQDNVKRDSDPTRQMDTNPYATPQAELIDSAADDEPQPEKVPAGSATAWLGRSYWHFKQNPFAWIGALIIFIVLSMGLSFVPVIGALAVNLLSPVIMAGFSIGAQEQDNGGDFRIGHLFAGFSQNFGALVMVGVFYLLFIILIGAVFGGIIGLTMAGSGMIDPNAGPQVMMNSMGPISMILMLLALMLIVFVAMAYYYAPTLIALDNMSALAAMKMSLNGCLKNWLALLVFGILAFLLLVIGMIPAMLGLLVVIPMLQASIYVSYRDIFHHQD